MHRGLGLKKLVEHIHETTSSAHDVAFTVLASLRFTSMASFARRSGLVNCAIAAIFVLQAHAARISNLQVGLEEDIRRAVLADPLWAECAYNNSTA